jgi:hypothetical protein
MAYLHTQDATKTATGVEVIKMPSEEDSRVYPWVGDKTERRAVDCEDCVADLEPRDAKLGVNHASHKEPTLVSEMLDLKPQRVIWEAQLVRRIEGDTAPLGARGLKQRGNLCRRQFFAADLCHGVAKLKHVKTA